MSTPHPLAAAAATVLLSPIRPALQAGHTNLLEVLVRVQGADAPADLADRVPQAPAPRAIALVIDASGSMAGRPLEQARRCAEWMVARLRPQDHVAVVRFDQDVELLWPAVPLGDGHNVRRALRSIEPGGATALHGGWLTGAQALSDVPVRGVRRVVLLSDGEANAGETHADTIAAQCAEWAARGVSTSTFGLGNAFNEGLMVAMARAGGGAQHFGRTADDLIGPFERELDLINQLCLRELRLALSPSPGVGIELLNALPQVDGLHALPDLAHGAEAWALLRLTVPAAALQALQAGTPLFTAQVSGQGTDGQPVQLDPVGLRLPVVDSATWHATPADEGVQRRVIEVAAAQALARMRALAERGDMAAVQELLQSARQEFAGSDWVRAILDDMQRLAEQDTDIRFLRKELLYSACSLTGALRAKHEAFEVNEAAEAAVPSFLRRRGAQGTRG